MLALIAPAAGSSVFSYLIVVFVGLNFVFELALNLIVSPAILRLVEIGKRTLHK